MRWSRSIKVRVAGFRRLSKRDRRAFVWAVTMLPLIRLGLRIKGLNTVQRWLAPRRVRHRSDPHIDADAEALLLARTVHLAANQGVGGSNCLPRSLVLWSLLRRRGLDAQLRVGVGGNSGEDLKFHAWVESSGQVLNDVPDVAERYLPFQGTIEPRKTGF